MIAADRQSSDYGNRDRIQCVTSHLARRYRTLDRACRDTEIGYDLIVRADNIGTREAAFVLQGSMPQPIVQHQISAIEGRKIVVNSKRNRSRKRPFRAPLLYFCHAGVRRSSSLSFG